MYIDGVYLGVYVFYVCMGITVLNVVWIIIRTIFTKIREREEKKERDKRELMRLKRERDNLAADVEYLTFLLSLHENTGA